MQLREFEGVTHARLAGRDGGVAERHTKMWLGGTPDKPSNFRFSRKHARGSRIQGIRTGAPVNASRFFFLPDWAPYASATATCKCPCAWQAVMAASSRDRQQSGPVGCREYSLIFVPSETAPCSRASARVLVRGAARMRHFLAKESEGNAGRKRASERLCPKNADASMVDRPTEGTILRHLADFRIFFETRERTKFRTKSIRTGRATATRRRRQAEARLALCRAHCIFKRFCEPPPRLVLGRRASCVDRVPSASRKRL